MILVDTKTPHNCGDRKTVNVDVQIRGSEEIIYNDMIILLQHIKKDEKLQRIFIDATARFLSGGSTILYSEDRSNDKDK